jgi:(p)ppGpp synthase/HD superfamily hydrolase
MRHYFAWQSIARGAEARPVLTARFGEALCLAVGLHRRQARKGTAIPYASHLLAVAASVLEHGGGEDQAIAALLHDALEDQQSSERPEDLKAEIQRLFGREVLEIVLACSDSELARVPDAALLVSLADKAHDARALLRDFEAEGEALWARFSGGRDGTLGYYRAVVEAFRGRGEPALFADLERTVGQLEQLAVDP